MKDKNDELKKLKFEAHTYFDIIWMEGYMSRKDAYKWLSKKLNIPLKDCHIKNFNIGMCYKVIKLSKKYKSIMLKNRLK